MSQKVDGDILYFLKKGYKIVSVVSAEEGLITYILNYNDQKIIHCTTNIYGAKLFCFSLEITVDANLSPDGSPVSINIFFI